MENGYYDLFNMLDLKEFLEAHLFSEVDIVPRDGVRPVLREKILKEIVNV